MDSLQFNLELIARENLNTRDAARSKHFNKLGSVFGRVINGWTSPSFSPSGGVQQGCPLSPLLHIKGRGATICMGGWRETRRTVPHYPGKGLLASPQQTLLIVTGTVTVATSDGSPLVARNTREASDLDETKNWRFDRHGHHSGARLDVGESFDW